MFQGSRAINGPHMNPNPTSKRQLEPSPLRPDSDLGLAILIAADDDSAYEPVNVVSTLREAYEIAASDMAGRRKRLERGDEPGICPARYELWVPGHSGYAMRVGVTVGTPPR